MFQVKQVLWISGANIDWHLQGCKCIFLVSIYVLWVAFEGCTNTEHYFRDFIFLACKKAVFTSREFSHLLVGWYDAICKMKTPTSILKSFSWSKPFVHKQWVFWADQCRYQAHKGTTIVGAEGRNFQNFCLQIILKMHPLALPVLRFLCNIFQITWAYLRKILFHGWFFKIPCRVWLNRLWMGRDLRFTRFWIFLTEFFVIMSLFTTRGK